jgi:GNAT superfamily N-acetyltransferase
MNGDVVGYSYAAPFRSRPAYRFTVENSVYVDHRLTGRGVGHHLLSALIGRCAFHVRIWIWDRPGDGRSGERREIMNGKRAGSYADITDMIYTRAREHSVAVGPDDITIDDH